MNDLFLGIEIGGTKQQIAIGSTKGRLLYVKQEKVLLVEGAPDIIRWLEYNIPVIIRKQTEFRGRLVAIGVGFGGPVESSSGRVLTSVQVRGWQDFMLRQWFEGTFGLPSIVVNDTVAGGYGEYRCGTGKGAANFVYTNIGSGIGGMFILDGRYYDGQGYGAAYIGHTFVPDWTAEAPGAECKVEDLCSGWSIEKRLRRDGYVPDDSEIMTLCGGKRENITCLTLGEAARNGDSFALQEIDKVAKSFSIALANVITLISPQCVAIGGGVANLGDILLDPIRRYTDERVFISSKGRYRIVQSVLGDKAVLVGAVLFAAQMVRGHI